MAVSGRETARGRTRKEVDLMQLEAPELSWRHHIKRPVPWIFAAALGMMVSIADVKLPAETRQEPLGTDRLAFMPAADPILDSLSVFPEVEDELEAYVTQFEPSREPEFDSFDLLIHQAAGQYNVDFNLIRAIISAESGGDYRARSKKGAKGLMQLMPITALELDVVNLYDPAENIDAGVRYFRLLLDRFEGDVELALAAYNAGPSKVLRHDGVPPYRETRSFVAKVINRYSNSTSR